MGDGSGRLRAAIVGAGVAGVFAAHFLRARLGLQVEPAVLEQAHRVGGRVEAVDVAGVQLEAGAAALHSTNRYLVEAMASLGFADTGSASRPVGPRRNLAVWNGQSFDCVVPHGDGGAAFLFDRYGPSLVKVQALLQDLLARLLPVYELQDAGEAFATPRELWQRLGLYPLSQVDTYTFLRQQGVGENFVLELADGLHRANYGQSGSLNALAGSVSLIGGGLDGGRVFGVVEGTGRLLERLLAGTGARVHLETGVAAVTAAPAGRYGTGFRITTRGGQAFTVDAVIIAAPLELAQLELGAELLQVPLPRDRPFQTTHVTFVAGRLRPAYFGLESDESLPGVILTREREDIPFSSLSVQAGPVAGDDYVYKIFSRRAPDEALLDAIFARRREVRRRVWHAYPVLPPTADWPPFRLAPGLYYVNAMESAVSTMETEAIAARNVVNLLVQDLGL